ncbi:hypothetical protein DFJ73DRAFT_864561 [Zopfochytrium polystomum]|nr:hypothetical protein DFJ73DRAFT_864561 [Zopfochytrium polystomum]
MMTRMAERELTRTREAVAAAYKREGWLVRDGVKFGAELVLYREHPSLVHADYAVVIVPRQPKTSLGQRSLTWSHVLGINRVNSRAKKTVVLATVSSSYRFWIAILEDLVGLMTNWIRGVGQISLRTRRISSNSSQKSLSSSVSSDRKKPTSTGRDGHVLDVCVSRWMPARDLK